MIIWIEMQLNLLIFINKETIFMWTKITKTKIYAIFLSIVSLWFFRDVGFRKQFSDTVNMYCYIYGLSSFSMKMVLLVLGKHNMR